MGSPYAPFGSVLWLSFKLYSILFELLGSFVHAVDFQDNRKAILTFGLGWKVAGSQCLSHCFTTVKRDQREPGLKVGIATFEISPNTFKFQDFCVEVERGAVVID